jgi:hypothetical protein
LPVGQQLVIAFGPSSCSTSEAGGRSAPSSIAAGPCKRLRPWSRRLSRAASPDGEFDSNAASMPALRPRSLAPIEAADVEQGNPYFATSPSRSAMSGLRRFEPSGVRKKRPFTDGVAHGSSRPKTDLGLFLPLTRGGWRAGRQRSLARDRAGPGLLRHPVTLGGPKPPTASLSK